MSVVFERPYRFVPPHRGNWWPNLIQFFHLIDRHLREKEGVVSHECRFGERLAQSLERGHGILLAPNHCRYADPIVLGWLAREVNTHLYAMASWHLFNENAFQSFALRRMGGFSVYREGSDRQSLDMAIQILETADRPLILFPEGTTNRTNDVLKPLLDGVTFIARTAARRRAKREQGRVVIHPVGLKYLCATDYEDWARQELAKLEQRMGWRDSSELTPLRRTLRLAEAMLSLREIECFGTTQTGDLRHRRDALMTEVLERAEQRLHMQRRGNASPRERIRKIRTEAAGRYFGNGSDAIVANDDPSQEGDQQTRHGLREAVAASDLAQHLISFPECYFQPGQATDTRIVETIQRIQEAMYGKASDTMPLHAVIEVDEPIEVPPEKAPRGKTDPLLTELEARLEQLLRRLSREARPVLE